MEETKKSGVSTAALVLGIIGICLSFIPILNNIAFVLGILAVVFGIVALIKKQSTVKTIISLVLAILAIVITLVIQKAVSDTIDDVVNDLSSSIDEMTGGSTEELLKNSVNVTFGKFNVEESDFWDTTSLEVTIKNIGSEKASFSVSVEAVDENGTRIADDTMYVNDLAAGQDIKEKVFTLVESEKIDALKTATFRVYEVSKY